MLALFVAILGGLAFLGGLAVFVWQVYHWLRTGTWSPRSVLDYTSRGWGASPLEWSWLRTIASVVPASLAGMVGGPFLMGCGAAMRDAFQRARRPDKA